MQIASKLLCHQERRTHRATLLLLVKVPAMQREEFEKLSASSRFNLRFMKRTNWLAIIIFFGGITIKVIYELFFKH